MSAISYVALSPEERALYQGWVDALEPVERGQAPLPVEFRRHTMGSDEAYVKHALEVFRERLAKGNPLVHRTMNEALDLDGDD